MTVLWIFLHKTVLLTVLENLRFALKYFLREPYSLNIPSVSVIDFPSVKGKIVVFFGTERSALCS